MRRACEVRKSKKVWWRVWERTFPEKVVPKIPVNQQKGQESSGASRHVQ
jgi:hypothetical protein